MTDPLDLDALEAIARAATPGPWEFCDDHVIPRVEHGSVEIVEAVDLDDAAHIATFDPPTVRALIERVRGAEAENHRLRVMWDKSGKNDLITRAEGAEAVIQAAYNALHLESRARAVEILHKHLVRREEK